VADQPAGSCFRSNVRSEPFCRRLDGNFVDCRERNDRFLTDFGQCRIGLTGLAYSG
jgi:hypothetical protein